MLIVQSCEYHLNGIPYRVHWIRKRLTIQLNWIMSIIRSNIYDGNTVMVWIRIQMKVEEADFDDVSTGNCDIPGASAVWRVVVREIRT